jgi:hypothetical protein
MPFAIKFESSFRGDAESLSPVERKATIRRIFDGSAICMNVEYYVTEVAEPLTG